MGDFSNLLHKRGGDHGSNTLSKLPPMYSSPKITGAGAAIGISSRASSFGFDAAETPQSTSPAIDYRDVFGGPPRYASSMFPSQAGSLPTLEEVFMTNSRPSSMKASTPVFELPVFDDDARGAKTYDLRPPSAVFGETRDLASPMENTRSKPSSRSGSRHMSPVHPSAYLGHHSRDESLITAGSPISRSVAGMFTRRCSSSSFSSMDPVDRKPPESPFTTSIAAPIGSSLPSSPFHASQRSNLGRSTGLNREDSARLSVSSDIDDVFGGFPQRNYSHTLFNNHEPSNSTACTRKAFEESSTKGPTLECRLRGSSSIDDFETARSADPAFCGSPFSSDEQGLAGDFIEINVDRRSELLAFQKAENDRQKAWTTTTDVNPQFRSSFKSLLAKPPPIPVSQLKVKSWKDWASELPGSQPAPTCEPSLEGTTVAAEKERHGNGDSISAYVKDWVETATLNISGQQSNKNAFTHNSRRSSSEAFVIGNKIKALSEEESVELDERELQVLLAKAWKVNEERERERKVAQQRREAYIKEKELQWKGSKKLLGRQFVAPNNQEEVQVEANSSESVVDTKDWRDFIIRERKMAKTPASIIVNNISKYPAEVNMERMESNEAIGTQGTDRNAREETCEIIWKPESQILSDVAALTKSEIGARGGMHIPEEQPMGHYVDAERSMDISQQEFVHCIDEDELSPAEGAEAEDFNVSSDGFQEVEGESVERRCLRWERHVRASKRAVKALEEKQQRDAEVQREQEEKQKSAESLDRTVKRWAAGKEGNLRALLSNLQHVLWSNSGWRPIPLTDLIEGVDVKKAYRKATLFVHPDKVQQKGATLQQKYIAERVFDILQEAWKTFNLQELF